MKGANDNPKNSTNWPAPEKKLNDLSPSVCASNNASNPVGDATEKPNRMTNRTRSAGEVAPSSAQKLTAIIEKQAASTSLPPMRSPKSPIKRPATVPTASYQTINIAASCGVSPILIKNGITCATGNPTANP